MPEKMPPFERKESEPEPWFELLDIVKIDGRWAQIVGALREKNPGEEQLITYLDDGSPGYVDFQKYELSRLLATHVAKILKAGELSEDEFKNVRWDSDNIGTKMSLHVHVFGEFIKKE